MHLNAKQRQAELNTSSVADIAFLLLSFFLMTTVISEDKGLAINLPEWRDVPIEQPVNEKNLFKIQINSANDILVEGEIISSLAGLRARIKQFVLNAGEDPASSESPEKAIVSLKTDRGTTQQVFVSALDEIQAAYYEIYAERVGLTPEQYRRLDPLNAVDRKVIEKAKQGVPMNISLAEPASASR